ncbi:hypothetical protein GGI20_004687 [Coemansia sp. BCRC 34301]|nr:hypothetical protein GGI20_004687 [Coemansia sp. BCRC 34301]
MKPVLFRIGNLRFTREFAPFLGILSGTLAYGAYTGLHHLTDPGIRLHRSNQHYDRVVWTYRVSLGFLDTKRQCSEIPASVFGSVADAWFGCTATQWVKETRLAAERFRGHQQEAQWVERITEQLLCLVGMGACGGAVGQFRKVALRRDSAPKARGGGGKGKQQYVVSQLCVGKDDLPAVTILDMWRQLVSEALCAAKISKDVLEWDIATELAAEACMEAVAEQELPLEDFAASPGWRPVLATWHTEPALQPVLYHTTASGSSRIATLVDLDEMDALFDQCSGLFHSLPALSPVACPEDLLLSWQQLEESFDDDNRYNRLADSLADDDDEWVAATPASGPTRGRRNRHAYSVTPPDTFMRRLEATPESVAREIRVAKEESQSKRTLELGPVPKVLAPATPVARPTIKLSSAAGSFGSGSRAFVPETPVPFSRTHSIDSSFDFVPETPLRQLALLPPIPSRHLVSKLSSHFRPRLLSQVSAVVPEKRKRVSVKPKPLTRASSSSAATAKSKVRPLALVKSSTSSS